MASSLVNISQFVAGGARYAQYSLSSSGLPYGTAPTTGAGAGMTDVRGFSAASINLPEPQILQIEGEDSVRAAIQFPANALPSFTMTLKDFVGSFVDALQGTTADDAQSVYNFYMLNPDVSSFPDIFLMLTRRSVSTVAGSEGNGYETIIFPLCTVGFTNIGDFATGPNAADRTVTVTVNRVSQLPWGEALTTGAHGTTQASGFVFWSEQIPTFDVFAQDATGTDNDYLPTKTLASNTQVIAWDDIAGTSATLSVTWNTPTASQFNFTATTDDNVSLFLYERTV